MAFVHLLILRVKIKDNKHNIFTLIFHYLHRQTVKIDEIHLGRLEKVNDMEGGTVVLTFTWKKEWGYVDVHYVYELTEISPLYQ